jgi:hypothetical protein
VADDLLVRLRRNTFIACGVIAVLALVADPRRPAAALGVLGGGVLVAISYFAVAFTIEAFMPVGQEPSRKRPKRAWAALLFAGHYALLAFAAYVMIGRLRLHPIGLVGGVTSFVVAVALEARRPGSRG